MKRHNGIKKIILESIAPRKNEEMEPGQSRTLLNGSSRGGEDGKGENCSHNGCCEDYIPSGTSFLFLWDPLLRTEGFPNLTLGRRLRKTIVYSSLL
ncbi:hypothetical protein PoB_000021000 [Plakobranchus ocellatus]|uniref:Uncharacterized protein n=1 Tax=Plakobranchus ocellatus TaxID=259542 RepID=A0AAV3XT31_9GAST|nr:hypothetical protein PoB_000021000 [Plakobranchus ocellatus]